ncbi:MAG: glycosyltransferase family 25 protein [Planctomycetaceae bacterium]|nr:glycosyltransferase family 25 protein [Planctomycetaceae bacterium]
MQNHHNSEPIQNQNKFDCYIINLDISVERWNVIERCEELRKLNVIRVSAVNGAEIELPHPDFSAWKYFWFCGRKPTRGEIGCYFSHIKAIKIFLESQKAYCIIGEDDFEPVSGFTEIIEAALEYGNTWDILRFFNTRRPFPYADLGGGYKLASPLRPGSMTTAYMINRKAAEKILSRCVPMWKPFDSILFSDVPFLKESVVYPFPVINNDSRKHSDIDAINGISNQQRDKKARYSWLSLAVFRFLTVIPWRFYSYFLRYACNFTTAILRRFPVKKVPLRRQFHDKQFTR